MVITRSSSFSSQECNEQSEQRSFSNGNANVHGAGAADGPPGTTSDNGALTAHAVTRAVHKDLLCAVSTSHAVVADKRRFETVLRVRSKDSCL